MVSQLTLCFLFFCCCFLPTLNFLENKNKELEADNMKDTTLQEQPEEKKQIVTSLPFFSLSLIFTMKH